MNVLLIYDLQGFLHKYPTECLRLQEMGLFFENIPGGGPPTPHTLGRYPYYTIPQIYLRDIPHLATQTIKKIAFKNFIKATTECPQIAGKKG